MPATVEDVRALDLGGGFCNLTAGQVENAIKRAALFVHEPAWDRDGKEGRGACAITLLAAHLLASAPKGSRSTGAVASGPVTAQAGGGLSRSYGSVGGAMSESSFASTYYGLQFLELKKTVVTTPLVSC